MTGVTQATFMNQRSFGPLYPTITTSGATETTSGNYKIATFNGSGSFTVTKLGTDPTEGSSIGYLVVAGGGASPGSAAGGAGGAGGMVESSSQTISVQTYTVTVGAGGVYTPPSTIGDANDSSISPFITATRGGKGGNTPNGAGQSGGSGGGGGANASGGSGTSGQGNAGGPGVTLNPGTKYAASYGGGGGGKGAGGGSGTSNSGGIGAIPSVFGGPYLAGGGGGAPSGAGGLGGGSAAGSGAATANTGGGAGAIGYNGGSGIVKIKWRFQ